MIWEEKGSTMKLHLGIIYNKTGKLINRRSLLKILINPFLRVFGVTLGTPVKNNRIVGHFEIFFHKPSFNLFQNLRNSWCYWGQKEEFIVLQERMWW